MLSIGGGGCGREARGEGWAPQACAELRRWMQRSQGGREAGTEGGEGGSNARGSITYFHTTRLPCTCTCVCCCRAVVSTGQDWFAVSRIRRTPIIVTGNDFSKMFAPLIRDGRMDKVPGRAPAAWGKGGRRGGWAALGRIGEGGREHVPEAPTSGSDTGCST